MTVIEVYLEGSSERHIFWNSKPETERLPESRGFPEFHSRNGGNITRLKPAISCNSLVGVDHIGWTSANKRFEPVPGRSFENIFPVMQG